MVLNLKTMIFHIFVKCIRGHITGTELFCVRTKTKVQIGYYVYGSAYIIDDVCANSDLIITIQHYAETVKVSLVFYSIVVLFAYLAATH